MDVPNQYPLSAKHPLIAEQFANWWLYLNTVGVFSFGLFLGSVGAGPDKYFCGLLSVTLVVWFLWAGKSRFPRFIKKLRDSKDPEDKRFEKELMREQFPIFKVPLVHWPYWLGLMSLLALAVQPLVGQMDLSLYVPEFYRK